jgi:hypothetical protein
MFDYSVLRRIFGSKRDEVTKGWGKIHNQELYDLYSSKKYYSLDQMNNNVMGWACGKYGREES